MDSSKKKNNVKKKSVNNTKNSLNKTKKSNSKSNNKSSSTKKSTVKGNKKLNNKAKRNTKNKTLKKEGFFHGFTMIELLATVVILGILSVIAISSVQRILDKSKTEYYANTEENIEMAAQTYYQNNRNHLPKNIGQTKKVYLNTLKDSKYIDTIKDKNDKNCDMDASYVEIIKYSQNSYSYQVYLKCGSEYETNLAAKGDKVPTIDITMPTSQGVKGLKASVTVNGNADKDRKLISYSYIIYKAPVGTDNYAVVKDSGSRIVRNKSKSFDIALDEYIPGRIKIQVTGINEDGLKFTETSSAIDYNDLLDPLCPDPVADVDTLIFGSSSTWSEDESRTIKLICRDASDGSGCARPYYTKVFTEEISVGYITIQDKAGRAADCPVNVNLDRSAPTLTIYVKNSSGTVLKTLTSNSTEFTMENLGWYNKDYSGGITLEYSVSDNGGLTSISLEKDTNMTSSSVSSYGTPSVTNLSNEKSSSGILDTIKGASYNGQNKYKITVTDVAGKKSVVNVNIKYDVSSPSLTVTNSSGGNWTNSTVTLGVNASDLGSGMSNIKYSYDQSTWYDDWDITKTPVSVSGNWSAQRNTTVYFKGTDLAGNVGTNITTLKIDTAAPILESVSPTGGACKVNSITATATGADDNSAGFKSKIKKWQYRVTAAGTTTPYGNWIDIANSAGKGSVSVTLTTKGEYRVQFRAIDQAGNVSNTKYLTANVQSSCCSKTNYKSCTAYYSCRSAAPDTWKAGLTNVHNSASTSSSQQIQVRGGTKVYVISTSGNFYYIYIDDNYTLGGTNPYYNLGRYGYIKKGCVQTKVPNNTNGFCYSSSCPN